jgi:hypothetical protein
MTFEQITSPAPVLDRPLKLAEREYWINQEDVQRAEAALDEDILFKWHWPVGTFDLRMSAWEIARFVLPHMASILPFFSHSPRVYVHFKALLDRLLYWPKEVTDEVVPWIRRVEHCEPDEILILHIRAHDLPPAPAHFVLGRAAGIL